MSAPSSRYLSTISRPRPVPPPVTRMRLPLNNPGWNMMCPLRENFARVAGRPRGASAAMLPHRLPAPLWRGWGRCPSCLLLFRPEYPARGPVGFFYVAQDNLHRGRLALEQSAGLARDAFDEFALDFGGAAFEHLDMDQRHDSLQCRQG